MSAPVLSKAERCRQAYLHDAALWDSGLIFAGIDEAGRGPLAGCVMAGCVVMPREPVLKNIYDSKQLSARQRDTAFSQILETAVFRNLGRAEVEEIDSLNILEATRLAMRRAAMGAPAGVFLVDAVTGLGLPGREMPIIGGDAASYAIAAASILAKVARDREMLALDEMYPQYGFGRHKGYGTKEHIAAIRQFGPCPAHRHTFLRNILPT